MLQSSGSSTRNSLQRTQSTTSVKDRRKHPLQAEPIDPYTARTHALIAAHRAVDRSRASTSTELSRSDSVVSRRTGATPRNYDAGFSPATHLRRQRSTLQTRVPRLAESLQAPGVQVNRSGAHKQFDYVAEFGLQGESYGAEPSSYRRLRRSKSLITPARQLRQPVSRTPETVHSQAPTFRTAASSVVSRSPGLKIKLKRSLNFIRQSHPTDDRVFTAPSQLPGLRSYNSEAVMLARNQYYQDLDKKESSEKSSPSFVSKSSRADKTFRRSFRTNDSVGRSMPPPIENPNKTVGSISQRSSSISLGNKIKKLFTKSKQGDALPPQQLEASRPHFNVDLTTPSLEAGFDSYLDTEPESTTRKSLHVPSEPQEDMCDTLSQLSQHLSQSSSCGSLSSKSKSRVTSWSNSTTTAGSVCAPPPTYEAKRLSVIKEDGGPHQPSSSAGRHIGGVPLFQQPLNFPQGRTIDSQRIYSALIKRIDEEQKEMEKTRNALQEIHEAQDQDEIVGHYLFSAPTIRRVESRESTPLAKIEENLPSLHSKMSPMIAPLKTPNTSQPHRISGNRNAEIQQNSLQPNACTVSNKDNALYQSPVRKVLEDKKPQASPLGLSSLYDESDSVIQTVDGKDPHVSGNKRFNQSTDSVYSRTTNGGTNIDYFSPIGSMEDFRSQLNGATRLDTVLTSAHAKAGSVERPPSRTETYRSGTTPNKGPWKLWMDYQLKDLNQRRPALKSTHVREHAQIDPDDTGIAGNPYRNSTSQAGADSVQTMYHNDQTILSSSAETHRGASVGLRGSRPSAVQLKEVPRNVTPIPKKDSILRRSQSALLGGETRIAQSPSADDSTSHGVRRISPTNVATMLKFRKSQPILSGQMDLRKENTPVDKHDSPPVSTPGRYRLQRQYGTSTGRIRSGKSTTGPLRNDDEPWIGSKFDSQDDSPSDRLKSMLSARLSKPFDMDIPDRNRPFDSIYLGKRDVGNGNRLSVAPSGNILRRPKTYGDLGRPPYLSSKRLGDTRLGGSDATTQSAHSAVDEASRTISGSSFGSVGKRMISSILKSRKKQENDEAARFVSRSPAFI